MKKFWFHEIDISSQLPNGWEQAILSVCEKESKFKVLVSSSVTSRELSKSIHIPVFTVGGETTKAQLPWLYDLYAGKFKDLAQSLTSEPVSIAKDDRYAININVQRGSKIRYECHVDSNPIEGLLYVTNHPPGTGGELVVSSNTEALGVEEISKNATRIYPETGKLVFFDARAHPHFVAPLGDDSCQRVVVAMNYYLPSCPESDRPADLNRHLGIE